ncbi:hypothetical protein KPL78_04200 [Roseomonas sp. HJA6]|uniref:Uncharacterized protein n=1 Tax=Roseomonas alba TaxID=2846776 RepID=A0ABS7A415_9PROT|nr:hypothetical protein [Neoroseomonas alba]MBW6397034.1 hypothetical protein [Neoroseomonas alba]
MSSTAPEAVAWAEMAFESSLIGVRAAVARALVDLRAVARAGGDVDRARCALLTALRGAEIDSERPSLGVSMSFGNDPIPRGIGPVRDDGLTL